MMKKTIYTAALAAVLCLAGCTHDLDYNMVGDKVGFATTTNLTQPSIFDEEINISIIKSGKGFSSAKVTIEECSQAELDKFNDTTYNFKIAPADKFTVDATEFSFSKDDIRKTAHVTWNRDWFANSYNEGTDYAIAFKIAACDIDVDTTRTLMVIHPLMSSVTFADEDLKNVYPSETDGPSTAQYSGTVKIDNALEGMDATINIKFDNSLIPEISAKRGVEYEAAPDGLFKLDETSITIAAGESFGYFKYTVDQSVLFDSKGKLKEYGKKYIAPVKIASTNPDILGRGQYAVGYMIATVSEDDTVTPPEGRAMEIIHGPWEILEGADNYMGTDPKCPDTSWYGNYNVSKLVDWNFTAGPNAPENGYWGSWYWTEPNFPMTFVFDTGADYIFGEFDKVDANSFAGQFRDFEVYVAREYAGADTDWKLAAKGETDYAGWQAYSAAEWEKFNYVIPKDATAEGSEFNYTRGQYIKLVIVKTRDLYPSSSKGGYLMEFYAKGWLL